jgi:hypothetical protein
MSAAAIAAACLALAACTSTPSASAPVSTASGPAAVGKPVSGGTVTVKQGNKVICVMTVVNGKGTCKVPATKFGLGTSQIYGTYSGGGRSASIPMTVIPAGTVTTLALAPATVTYGQEQAEHLSVTVTPAHGGTPTGTVTVLSGRAPVCVITLAAANGGAQGSCTLAATKLPVGSAPLSATYPGDRSYGGSISAPKTLTVVK